MTDFKKYTDAVLDTASVFLGVNHQEILKQVQDDALKKTEKLIVYAIIISSVSLSLSNTFYFHNTSTG